MKSTVKLEPPTTERGMVEIDRGLLDRVRNAANKHGFLIKALVEQGIRLRLAQLEESK